MQILFSADWHIKLGQKNVPREWAVNRYRSFFEQLHDLERSVDLHIIGGDLFDRLPSLEEQELFWEYVRGIQCPVILFDGNHEASKMHQSFLSYFEGPINLVESFRNDFSHSITLCLEPATLADILGSEYPEEAAILPYRYLKRKDWGNKVNEATVVFTHVRGEIPPHVKPEVPLELFDKFERVYAGDLHAHSNTQRNIVYPGSPMTVSFHRNEVDTGVIVIDSGDWSYKWKKLELPQLIRKTVSSVDEMIPTTYHHTIYEIEGDLESLSKVNNSDLLDKKVVKRSTEATLLLSSEMSILDELSEYLEFILELPDSTRDKVLAAYTDHKVDTE